MMLMITATRIATPITARAIIIGSEKHPEFHEA